MLSSADMAAYTLGCCQDHTQDHQCQYQDLILLLYCDTFNVDWMDNDYVKLYKLRQISCHNSIKILHWYYNMDYFK